MKGGGLSSDLILEAETLTRAAWGEPPADGWVTFVDRRRVRSSNPGYCFQVAGWRIDPTYRPGYRQRHLVRLRKP